MRYFVAQADQAKTDISGYGDWEWFVHPEDSDYLMHSMCSLDNCYTCPKFHPLDSVEESDMYFGSCELGYS